MDLSERLVKSPTERSFNLECSRVRARARSALQYPGVTQVADIINDLFSLSLSSHPLICDSRPRSNQTRHASRQCTRIVVVVYSPKKRVGGKRVIEVIRIKFLPLNGANGEIVSRTLPFSGAFHPRLNMGKASRSIQHYGGNDGAIIPGSRIPGMSDIHLRVYFTF